MIPPPETPLDPTTAARWALTRAAAALIRDHHVPADTVMTDARDGVQLATGWRPASGPEAA